MCTKVKFIKYVHLKKRKKNTIIIWPIMYKLKNAQSKTFKIFLKM